MNVSHYIQKDCENEPVRSMQVKQTQSKPNDNDRVFMSFGMWINTAGLIEGGECIRTCLYVPERFIFGVETEFSVVAQKYLSLETKPGSFLFYHWCPNSLHAQVPPFLSISTCLKIRVSGSAWPTIANSLLNKELYKHRPLADRQLRHSLRAFLQVLSSISRSAYDAPAIDVSKAVATT